MSRPLTVSFGTHDSLAVITSVRSVTWEQFAQWLTRVPPETSDKGSRGWYVPAEFSPPYRDSNNFVARHAITYDFDHVELDTWDRVLETWGGLAFAIYTTWSHQQYKPRFRVVMPLSRPATYDEFQAVARKVATDIDINLMARESFVPAQMMFAPTRKQDGEFRGQINEGEWLDVDQVLGEYENWTDKLSWPVRSEADGVAKEDAAVSPLDKPGIVGQFCRAFSIEDAIERFKLPYVKVR